LSELDLAKRLLEFGDKAGAVKELTRMLQADPDDIDAWFLMVDAIDEPDKKTDCYRQILRIDPGNQFAQIHLQKLNRRPFVSQVEEEDERATASTQLSEFRSAVVKKRPVKPAEKGLFGLDYQTTLLVGIVAFVVVVLLLFVIIVVASGVMQPPPPPTPTRIHLPPTWTPRPN
jgi:hypothetical protein